jgi:SagB-type dehydrogenase family enzyme
MLRSAGRRALAVTLVIRAWGDQAMGQARRTVVALPEPAREGTVSVETALAARESQREFESAALTLTEVGQLLWAAQGHTSGGRRTAPSAGALYPVELYAVVGKAEGLDPGIYHYRPRQHDLVLVEAGDQRVAIAVAAFQDWVKDAPVTIAIAAVIERTAVTYGSRARRYVHMEVGGVAENVYLQATALGLGTTFVAAFTDSTLARWLSLPRGQSPFGLMPIGRE